MNILENVFFYGKVLILPYCQNKWYLITHARIPTQHVLIFATHMGMF